MPNLYFVINFCPPFHPWPPTQSDITSLVQLARFSILFGRNSYKQQLVLGKLSSTVNWSTFCVSFIHNPWLLIVVKILKVNYLVNLKYMIFISFPKLSHIRPDYYKLAPTSMHKTANCCVFGSLQKANIYILPFFGYNKYYIAVHR